MLDADQIRSANEALAAPLADLARARHKADPSLPTSARSAQADAESEVEITALVGPISALRRRAADAQEYDDHAAFKAAACFGDAANRTVDPAGVERWLAGVRRQAEQRADTGN